MNREETTAFLSKLQAASARFANRLRELSPEQKREYGQTWFDALAPVDPFRAERVYRRWVNQGFPWPDELIPELRATLDTGSVEAPDPHRAADCQWCHDTGTCNVIARRHGDTEPRLYSTGCECVRGERWDAGKRFGEFSADMVRVPYTCSSVLDVDAIAALEASGLRGTDRWAEEFAARRQEQKEAFERRRQSTRQGASE